MTRINQFVVGAPRGGNMHITAKQIKNWAATREAQGALPRLVRRLIHITGDLVFVTFPSGDSINQASWDG